MFISRARYDRLIKRIETLEEYARRDYDRLGNHDKHIKSLNEIVGEERRGLYDMGRLMELYYGAKPAPRLSILETLSQIMDHIGLEVRHTRENLKVVKKPEPKTRVVKKKGAK